MKKILLLFTLLILALFTSAQTSSNVSWLPANPCAGSPINFTLFSNVPGSGQWLYTYWDFGDGNNGGTFGSSIQHTYSQQGVYNGTAILQDSITGSVDTALFTVFVTGDCSGMGYVSGTVYYDANGNGSQDSGEPGLPQQYVEITRGNTLSFFTTDSSGNYGYYNNPGNDTLRATSPNYYQQTSPSTPDYHVAVVTAGGQNTGLDFGMDVMGNVNDLRVYMYGGPPVPGFQRSYYIWYRNDGTTVMNPTLTFTYDGLMSYVSNSGSGTHSSANRTVTWSLGTLLPGDAGYEHVVLYADTTLQLGTAVTHYVQIDPISGDTTPPNNLDTLSQITVGSYDPNDKLVDDDAILPGQRLTYTVRFQNTGTWWATNVVIRDSLDANLDQGTLRIEGASHPMHHDLSNGQLTFTFPNIMLPDSGRDEPGSHGFVTYSIEAANGLADGTHIYNTAGIYFDFNAPIITNTTDNWVDLSSGVEQISEQFEVKLYPNPMQEFAWLKWENPGMEAFDFQLVDLNGRVVQEVKNLQQNWLRIDRDQLPAGLYLFKLMNHEGKVATGKLLLQ